MYPDFISFKAKDQGVDIHVGTHSNEMGWGRQQEWETGSWGEATIDGKR